MSGGLTTLGPCGSMAPTNSRRGSAHGNVVAGSHACEGARVTSAFVNPSWMPHSVGEAARAGDATADDLLSGRAWSHMLDGLRRASAIVLADDVPHNAADMAAGFRHLLVLLGIGLDNALREESGSVLAVKPSGRRRDLQVGHGLSRLHLHRRAAARRRDLPPLGKPWLGPLRRAAVDGRHGLLGQRPPGRARPRAERRGGPHPLGRAPGGELAGHRRERDDAGGPAFLLRLGHRGGVIALHRADRGARARRRRDRRKTRGRWWPAS